MSTGKMLLTNERDQSGGYHYFLRVVARQLQRHVSQLPSANGLLVQPIDGKRSAIVLREICTRYEVIQMLRIQGNRQMRSELQQVAPRIIRWLVKRQK